MTNDVREKMLSLLLELNAGVMGLDDLVRGRREIWEPAVGWKSLYCVGHRLRISERGFGTISLEMLDKPETGACSLGSYWIEVDDGGCEGDVTKIIIIGKIFNAEYLEDIVGRPCSAMVFDGDVLAIGPLARFGKLDLDNFVFTNSWYRQDRPEWE